MSYMTLMNEQDLPITGSPERYSQVYIANLYDDYAHIQPLRCRKDCQQCLTKQREQFKAFIQDDEK